MALRKDYLKRGSKNCVLLKVFNIVLQLKTYISVFALVSRYHSMKINCFTIEHLISLPFAESLDCSLSSMAFLSS